MVMLEYLSGIVSEMETQLWNFEEMPEKPSADDLEAQNAHLRKMLGDVNKWRRRSWWLLEELKENLEVLKYTGPHGASQEILEDFTVIKTRLEDCRQRIDSLLPTVMGTFSLLEARYASLSTRFSSWVAALATVFVPLSIASGIFTLSGDYQPGSSKFWVYWVVAIPLMVVVFMFIVGTTYYRSILNAMERTKHRKTRLRGKQRRKAEYETDHGISP
jgi:Mg2+ and Co2+ transporter CorA